MPTARIKKRRRIGKFQAPFVIVPKHQMRSKEPMMLADQRKIEVVELTKHPDLALRIGTRSGAYRHIKNSSKLRGKFWYRRVNAA